MVAGVLRWPWPWRWWSWWLCSVHGCGGEVSWEFLILFLWRLGFGGFEFFLSFFLFFALRGKTLTGNFQVNYNLSLLFL